MPRKPTVQPQPLYTFQVDVDNETIDVEVRDGSCSLISRGAHKRNAYEDRLWLLMDKVVDDYLSITGKKRVKNDYLNTATEFAIQAEIWGFGGVNGEDDSALRKKMYKDVKKQLRIFELALETKLNSEGTSCAQVT